MSSIKSGSPPPAFSDLSKSSKDVLSKDFYHDVSRQVEIKLKTPSGANVLIKNKVTQDSSVSASAEVKQTVTKGVTQTLSVDSKSKINAKIEAEDNIVPGLKVEGVADYLPNAAQKIANVKASLFFKQPAYHLRGVFDVPVSKGSNQKAIIDGVVAHERGFLAGAEVVYNIANGQFVSFQGAVGYKHPLYALTGGITNKFSGAGFAAVDANRKVGAYATIFQQVNPLVDFGARVDFNVNDPSDRVKMQLAAKYKINSSSFAKGRFSEEGIALAYNTKINSGLTLGLGWLTDSTKIETAKHKLGASFTFEG